MVITEKLKESIYGMIKESAPLSGAMFLKNWKRYKMSAELFMSLPQVKPGDSILDYGCGSPIVVKLLSACGYNITGFEPYAGPNELKVAQLLQLENNYVTQLAPGTQYQHVIMIDVIEHLAVIQPEMQKISSLIQPGGLLFISTPNVLRFDMWKKFVLRKTGHPTHITKYLEATDHYRNHQREFTMAELITTLKYFKFSKIVFQKIGDTQPTAEELNAYHQLLNDGLVYKNSINGIIQKWVLQLFPSSFKNNNLFIAAIKDGEQ